MTVPLSTAALNSVGGVNYTPYLPGSVWPSDSNRGIDGKPNAIEVADMPPQYAASCLGRLTRWARESPAGDLLLVDDVVAREELVRRSNLGMALADRALSLSAGEAAAFYHQDHPEADPNVVVARVMTVLHVDHGWDLEDCLDPALAVYKAINTTWQVTER